MLDVILGQVFFMANGVLLGVMLLCKLFCLKFQWYFSFLFDI